MEPITSTQNPKIRALLKLQKRKERDDTQSRLVHEKILLERSQILYSANLASPRRLRESYFAWHLVQM